MIFINMKNFIFLIVITILFIGCKPVRYVNVSSKHNYYEKHRTTTYTVPTWLPNVGIVLETRVYRGHRWSQPKRRYKRHKK